ncbi:MAG: HDOD domain-containing protein [Acidobacteriia bacterium]|nr:HDOD domain-containing protein [Terriglobia bacterium]
MPTLLAKADRPWALRLLPPFPAVANRILSLADSDDVTVGKISETIALDPTFTAEILRVANSAYFGATREIATIQNAVSLLGLNRVKTMATVIAVNSMVKRAMGMEILRKFWVHSLVTAILTEESARVVNPSLEGAHTAGLLHNLGTLGLMSAYPEEYARMLEVSEEYGFDLIQTERDLFEIDHSSAGAVLADEWNFPEPIVVAIARHHDEPPRHATTLYSLVQVCWRLADTLGFEAFPMDRPWTYEELIARLEVKKRSWLTAGVNVIEAEITSRISNLRL